MLNMKNIVFFLAIIFVLFHEDNAETCALCQSTFENSTKDCNAVKTYVKCLYDASGEGCDMRSKWVENAELKLKNLTSCDLTETCKCQVEFMKEGDKDDKKKCEHRKKEVACLVKAMGKGCDDTKSNADIVKASETKAKAVEDCALSTTCKCQVARAKADTDKTCDALQTEIDCLTGKKEKGCDGESSAKHAGEHARKILDKSKNCTKTDACKCEIGYINADHGSNGKTCIAAKAAKKCLQDLKTDTKGCGGKRSKDKVISDFAQPRIDEYCKTSGANCVSGLGVLVGICVLFLQLTTWM